MAKFSILLLPPFGVMSDSESKNPRPLFDEAFWKEMRYLVLGNNITLIKVFLTVSNKK